MKKLIFSLYLIIGISISVTAQGNESLLRFSFGGGLFFTSGSMDTGGSADFAFLIYQKNTFDVRNHFVFRGANFLDGGIMMITEKISFGGMVTGDWRSYGYIEGGIGATANKTKGFFEPPFTYSIGGGGGTDLFLTETMSIYFEAGGFFIITNGVWNGGSIFQIGWRSWF